MNKQAIDLIKYLLGMIFNAAVFIFIVWLIFSFTQDSYDVGRAFAAAFTNERAPREVEIVIPDGAAFDEVAEILYENDIISSVWLFRLEKMLKGATGDFEGGTFTVNAAMDTNQLMAALRSTDIVGQGIRVTIREGSTIRDIGVVLEAAGVIEDAEEFVRVADEEDFPFPFLVNLPNRPNRLEGYLFPDTYMFMPNSDPWDIAMRMLGRFDQIFTWEHRERAYELSLTVDEVVIIASIIEKEIRVAEERALASAVIHNRLKLGEPLGMCSTIQYVLDKRRDRLLDEDLQIDSPYNTYIHAGLPIGPIANPGLACIDAALWPANVDYRWFVVSDEETGEHYFTNNYDDFLRARTLYLQRF
ncbi:MAG: endolytic transglycosylase MltG [Defluviitaleaceae bacterium]|nr:endolytic transglycosylase MltG [Defluviitaleaceae bacterium]